MDRNKKFTVGGLCSGVGGIEYGFKKAGFDISWANDMDKYAMQTYGALHHTNHYIGKKPYTIKEILKDKGLSKQLSKVDVLVSGFPCQPFSLAGHRKGFEDERGTVIGDIFELAKVIGRPKVLFLENVKNFRNHDGGKTFSHIREYLQKELKYSVCDIIFNACDYTKIPQNRERTFMICFKDEPLWEHPDIFNDINMLKSKAPLTSFFYENLPTKKVKTDPKENFLNEEIRFGRLTRDDAIKLAIKYDGYCDRKHIDTFCSYIEISVELFWNEVKNVSNKNLFKIDKDDNLYSCFEVGVGL